jgi:hypothetical protein
MWLRRRRTKVLLQLNKSEMGTLLKNIHNHIHHYPI